LNIEQEERSREYRYYLSNLAVFFNVETFPKRFTSPDLHAGHNNIKIEVETLQCLEYLG